MNSRSRDEQECAQASSYDRQLFDNLASQMIGDRPGCGGKTIIHCRKKQSSHPLPTRKGGLWRIRRLRRTPHPAET